MRRIVENKNVSKKLQDHERRISALEKILKNGKKSKITGKKKTLSDYIIELRDNGFFSQPKTAEETHKKLSGKYFCEFNRVEVSLLRLAEKKPKQLRITSKVVNKKKYKAYVW